MSTSFNREQWERWIPRPPVLVAWAVLLVVLLFAYWPMTVQLVGVWLRQHEDYAHAFLVPVFSLFLLWYRREMADPLPVQGTWWAVPFFALWALIRWVSVYFNYSIDWYSLFPLLAGITLLLGGWRAFRWAWPSIVFLIFMMPLPAIVTDISSWYLRMIATRISLFVIQTLGFPAMLEGGAGHVISLESGPLAVAEACSGLRSLLLFLAIGVGAAFVMKAQVWEKVVVAVSAIPIAILGNVARITLIGVLNEKISPEAGDWFHKSIFAAVTEMGLAVLMVWGLITLMSKLLVEPVASPLTLGGSRASPPRGPAGVSREPAGASRGKE